MQKKELRSLRRLDATPAITKRAEETVEVVNHDWINGRYRPVQATEPKYSTFFRIQNLKQYIKIAVFLQKDIKNNIHTPRYEIFVNVKGGEWITRELDEDGKEKRWLTAMVWNLEGIFGDYWYPRKETWMNRDAMNTLGELPVKDKDRKGIQRLGDWQEEQREKRIAEKEKKEQKPWDDDMALVPKMPQKFVEWMRKDAANEFYIIYEYDKKGTKKGFCSRCRKMVPISGPKHNEKTVCPSCGAAAEFKAHSRIKTLQTGEYYGEIIQRISGGIVVRRVIQSQSYRNTTDYRKPCIRTDEIVRVLLLDDGSSRKYDYGNYKNKCYRWIPRYISGTNDYYWARRIKLYKGNIKELKKTTRLGRSTIDLWDVLPTPVSDYLDIECGNPAVEMLARIGMFRLTKDLIRARYDKNLLDQNETELTKMLKIDRPRLKRLRKMNGGISSLKWIQAEKHEDTIWPDDMIESFGDAGIEASNLGFLPHPVDYLKAYRYIAKQRELIGETTIQTLTTWRDYIYMAEQMKMDTKNQQIQRPKNVKEAHDRLVRMRKEGTAKKEAEKIEKKWPKVNKQLKKLERFEFAKDGYCIKAPKNVYDIVMEGEILSHCVHRCDYYFERITNDESYLFFLRKVGSLDMPWYTLEVEPSGNIRQKRTTGDNQNPDFEQAVPFLKAWQQYFKKQLTKKEKELGKKSDELRRENYKKLREDGKVVWHGKLAGQLLADVLEKDFMEVM
jgi:hypothetical protein